MTIFHGKQILVLENEALICLELVNALEEHGAAVIAARSPERALELLEFRHIHGAILDVGTDEASQRLCCALEVQNVPFILYTGASTFVASASTLVAKPAHPETVVTELERVIARSGFPIPSERPADLPRFDRDPRPAR